MHYLPRPQGLGQWCIGSSTAPSVIELTVASIRHEIVVLLPNQCKSKFTLCQVTLHLCLTSPSAWAGESEISPGLCLYGWHHSLGDSLKYWLAMHEERRSHCRQSKLLNNSLFSRLGNKRWCHTLKNLKAPAKHRTMVLLLVVWTVNFIALVACYEWTLVSYSINMKVILYISHDMNSVFWMSYYTLYMTLTRVLRPTNLKVI